jgi:uncharacterized membrane protein YfcA
VDALSPKALLFGLLAAMGIAFVAYWWAAERRRARAATPPAPVTAAQKAAARRAYLREIGVGALTDFLDALGIGSFAPTTSFYKLGRMVPDELIPGTMNVGHTLPTFAEAFIFISVIQVEMKTLSLMIAASVAGAWLGAGVVAGWPRRKIQIGMGVVLLAAAVVTVARITGAMPGGGNALGVSGALLAVAMAGNFVLGALMTLGIGLFAPCMILVGLLGMSADTAFPIMMGSCAFLMPAASARFIRSGRYAPRAALGLTIGGVPAALLAGLVVKNLPLLAVKWLVVAVVVYTAVTMLRSAAEETQRPGGKPHG